MPEGAGSCDGFGSNRTTYSLIQMRDQSGKRCDTSFVVRDSASGRHCLGCHPVAPIFGQLPSKFAEVVDNERSNLLGTDLGEFLIDVLIIPRGTDNVERFSCNFL